MIQHGTHTARSIPAVALAALCLAATPATSNEIGQEEYMNNCSSCHGASGAGDGELSRFLNVEIPSLTTLAERNDGVYPLLEVIHIIDGRSGLGPHGTLMPVWGNRFKASSVELTGEYGAEVIVRGRVLSLATYLETLQQ